VTKEQGDMPQPLEVEEITVPAFASIKVTLMSLIQVPGCAVKLPRA